MIREASREQDRKVINSFFETVKEILSEFRKKSCGYLEQIAIQ